MTRDEASLVIVTRVLAREGGIANVGDGAGLTRFGQTPGWLAQFGLRPPETVREAAENYRTFLVRTGLIGVCDYPDAMADAVIDFAVNSGHRTAIDALQRSLDGLRPDGIYGPETQAAVDACNRMLVAKRMLARRTRYIGRIVTDNPTGNAKFAAGWLNRIASQVEAL